MNTLRSINVFICLVFDFECLHKSVTKPLFVLYKYFKYWTVCFRIWVFKYLHSIAKGRLLHENYRKIRARLKSFCCDLSVYIADPIARINMLYYSEKAATVAIVFLMTIALCSTSVQELRTQFLKNKVLASSYASKQPISQLHCVEWCYRERQMGKWRIAGYHKSAKTCKLSMDYPYTLLNVADEKTGVFLVDEGNILNS